MRTRWGDAASGLAGDKPAAYHWGFGREGNAELKLLGGKKELLRSFDTFGCRFGTIYGLIDEDEVGRRRKRLGGGQTGCVSLGFAREGNAELKLLGGKK